MNEIIFGRANLDPERIITVIHESSRRYNITIRKWKGKEWNDQLHNQITMTRTTSWTLGNKGPNPTQILIVDGSWKEDKKRKTMASHNNMEEWDLRLKRREVNKNICQIFRTNRNIRNSWGTNIHGMKMLKTNHQYKQLGGSSSSSKQKNK